MGYAAHGLRKNRGIALAEIGASTHWIMAWLGHLSIEEADLYTKRASRRRILEGTEQERNRGNVENPVSKGAPK